MRLLVGLLTVFSTSPPQRDSKLKAAEKDLAKHKADLVKLREALTKATQGRDEIALEVEALKEEIASLEEQAAAFDETIKGLRAEEETAGEAVEAANEAFTLADNECVWVVGCPFFWVAWRNLSPFASSSI